jgi:hypothetical protein
VDNCRFDAFYANFVVVSTSSFVSYFVHNFITFRRD